MSNKNLLLITDSYPFGPGETFLESELPFLVQEFGTIYLVPRFISKKAVRRQIPSNCKVELFLCTHEMTGQPHKSLFDKGLNLKLLFTELRIKRLKWFIRNCFKIRKLASKAIYDASLISAWLIDKKIENYVTYTYWFSESATACAILKYNKLIPKWVSRIHGYDLYDERHELKKQPFINFKIDNCDHLYTVCFKGREYFLDKISKKNELKISNNYLGVTIPDSFVSTKKLGFVLVSSSNLIPLKRVDLIVEILKRIEFPLRWIHLGHGVLYDQLRELSSSLPKNITVEFFGLVEKEKVVKIYLDESPNLFIHLSETEGAPVAIMDALSCGIPILACDAGGVSEMVTPDIGKLLPIEFDVEEAVDFITKVKNNEVVFSPEKIQSFCKMKFSAETNYTHFAKNLAK